MTTVGALFGVSLLLGAVSRMITPVATVFGKARRRARLTHSPEQGAGNE